MSEVAGEDLAVETSSGVLPSFGVRAVLAALGAGAAAIHFAMIPAHAQEWMLLGVGFAVVGWLQMAGAAAVMTRPSRRVLWAIVVVNLGALAVWAWSRSFGLPWGPGAGTPDPLTNVDLTAAILEGLAVATGLQQLIRSQDPAQAPEARRLRRTSLAGAGAALVVAAVAVGTGTVLASPSAVHDHAHAHALAGTVEAADGHMHDGGAAPTAVPAPAHGNSHAAAATGPATAGQKAMADSLVAQMERSMSRFHSTADVVAAGYRSIGDGRTGFEHFVNSDYLTDPLTLDADRVESIVFKVNPDGTKQLVSGMFILATGTTMADVPDVAGPLTSWHDHQNLCWSPDGRIAGILVDGQCRPGGVFRGTSPMLHVWVVDNPCGRFAGIEGHGTAACVHQDTA